MLMKKIVALSLGLILSLSALAAQVDIYSDYAIVREAWQANIPQGQKATFEWQLAENIDLGSLTILNPNIDILSRIEEKKSQLTGRIVKVKTIDGAIFQGLLREKGQEVVLVNPEDGQLVVIINSNQITSIIPETPINFNQKLKLKMKNNDKSLDKLNVRYLSRGISWNVLYSLQLDGNKANLVGEYQIENNTSKPFEAASVRLIAKGDSLPMLYGRSANVMKASAEMSLDVSQQAESAIYEIPGNIDIPAEAKTRLPLLKENNLQMERRYQMINNRVEVEVTLNGISQTLPAGQLNIFDGDILASTQYLSSQPQSGRLVLNLGETLDIAGRREQIGYSTSGNKIVEEQKVTLKNNKKEKVTVDVTAYLPWENAIVKSKVAYKRTSANTVVFEVPVEANKETSFTYSVSYETK